MAGDAAVVEEKAPTVKAQDAPAEKKESARPEPLDFSEPEPVDDDIPAAGTKKDGAEDKDAGGKKEENGANGDDGEGNTAVEEFSNDLLSRAEDIGFSAEEAKEFGTAKELERALRIYERKMTQRGAMAAQVQAAPAPAALPNATEAMKVVEIPDLDAKEFDPAIVNGWNAMKTLVKSQREALERSQKDSQERDRSIKSLSDFVAQQQREQAEARFDKMIDGLGDNYHELFGKGAGNGLDPKGEHIGNRRKLAESVYALALGYSQMGKRVPAEPELFKRALGAAFGDRAETLAQKKIAEKVQKQRSQFIGRPTHREGAEALTPYQRAVRKVSEKIREKTGDDIPESF